MIVRVALSQNGYSSPAGSGGVHDRVAIMPRRRVLIGLRDPE
jgi:hypothetical protein